MLRTAHFSRSVGRSVGSSVGRSVGRRDEKLSAASAAAVAAVASRGDEERDECLPNNVVFVGGGGDGVQVEAVVRVKVVVLSVAKSSSSGHSRKFPHKVGGSASLLRTRLIVLWGKPESEIVVVMPRLEVKMHFTFPQTIGVGSAAAASKESE